MLYWHSNQANGGHWWPEKTCWVSGRLIWNSNITNYKKKGKQWSSQVWIPTIISFQSKEIGFDFGKSDSVHLIVGQVNHSGNNKDLGLSTCKPWAKSIYYLWFLYSKPSESKTLPWKKFLTRQFGSFQEFKKAKAFWVVSTLQSRDTPFSGTRLKLVT